MSRFHSIAAGLALATALPVLSGDMAAASDFFGPSQGLQLQPELDVIHGVGRAFRLVGKVEPTWTPSTSSDVMGFSLYGDWLVAPFLGPIVTPDLAKRHRLDVRAGISWYPFLLSHEGGTSLTPFANVEFIWTTSRDMWAQFRMQAGLQLSVDWFGKGQVIELNGSVITYLQPSRSHSPVIGAVWYQYF